MAPTLEDVSYLLGLPLRGHAIGPLEPPFDWEPAMAARFEGVYDGAPALQMERHGPKLDWLLWFQVSSYVSYLSFGMHRVTNTFSFINIDPKVS